MKSSVFSWVFTCLVHCGWLQLYMLLVINSDFLGLLEKQRKVEGTKEVQHVLHVIFLFPFPKALLGGGECLSLNQHMGEGLASLRLLK